MKQKGFTIVELLVVIVVIAVLAAIVSVAYNGIQQQARDARRRTDAAAIAKAMVVWSHDTGITFANMTPGHDGFPANGWLDGGYGGLSVRAILENGNYIPKNIDDPLRSIENSSRWHYMVAPCSDINDNRRVILVELENPIGKTIAQQVGGAGCNNSFLGSYESYYKVNFAVIADAR